MTRRMVDCTSYNLHTVNWQAFDIVAGYVTGSVDVKWTNAQIAKVINAKKTFVSIDQGFTGSPVANAIVRDVEPNAWTPAHAINDKPWTPARPTIYNDRNDMVTVINDGWTGDMWLAWPLNSAPTMTEVITAYPALKKVNLIGVQWGFHPTYDESVVYDDSWPNAKDVIVAPVPGYIEVPGVNGKWLNPTLNFDSKGNKVVSGLGLDGDFYYTVVKPDGTHVTVNVTATV